MPVVSATEAALENQRLGGLQMRVAALCTLVQVCDGYDLNAVAWAVPSLIRFGRQSRMAAEKLAGFLDRYVSRLATTDAGRSPLLRGALNA